MKIIATSSEQVKSIISREQIRENQEMYSYRAVIGHGLIDLKRTANFRGGARYNAKRGEISGFSESSRSRLLRMVACLNKEDIGLPLFITLTYPEIYPSNPEIWKDHLHNFRRELQRQWEGMAAIWRLEPQERGAPHYHLMVWGCEGLLKRKSWLSRKWFEVVGSGDLNHLKAGTSVEPAKRWRGVRSYVSKYLAKIEKGGKKQVFDYPVGRYWGVWNKPGLRIKTEEVELTREEFNRARRIIRKYYESMQRRKKAKKKQKRASMNQVGDNSGIWMMIPKDQGMRIIERPRQVTINQDARESGPRHISHFAESCREFRRWELAA